MSNQDVYQRIEQKLSQTSKGSSYGIIFKVDNILRMTNEAAYEPKMVSIGPYHRGKKNLQKMEKYKLEYLLGILRRKNEPTAANYIFCLMQYEGVARSYYAEEVSLDRDEFVEMMLLDGCFIVEFLRKFKRKYGKKDYDPRDPIFKTGWIVDIIRRDLLLFENQIPFFILVMLFEMTKIPYDDQEENLIYLAVPCLNECTIFGDTINLESCSSSDILSQPELFRHLLNLMYECSWFYYSSPGGKDDDQNCSNSDRKKRPEFSCITLGKLCCDNNTRQQQKEDPNDTVFIKSVSELKQYGVEFVKSEQSTSCLDIKFENGEIRIPPLVIHDGTESILRNLIAYEQYMFDLLHCGKFLTDYATFMDCLINTPMDVQELRVKGIIINWLGDDKEISDMVNKISNNVVLAAPDFTYGEIFKKVNEHCNKRSNQWISEFKRTHFKSPWSVISLLGVIILLILTLIQTIFSILQTV